MAICGCRIILIFSFIVRNPLFIVNSSRQYVAYWRQLWMSIQRREIKIFQDQQGKEPFTNWVSQLSRGDRARIFARLDRVEIGNLGDCKPVGDGGFELRLHFGAGYRIYFGEIGTTIVLLLNGGKKSSQQKDISKAKKFWHPYQMEYGA